MINDIRFIINQEQPLDAWLLNMIAQINEMVYVIIIELNLVINEVDQDVC